jgi:hypothetical protein
MTAKGETPMAEYIPFTEEQKIRANNVDIVGFLRSQGEEVTRSGHEYRWKRHDSVTVSGAAWYQHSAEQGGNAVSFVRKFWGLSYPEAVTMLLNGERGAALRQAGPKQERPKAPFALPEANGNMRRVYAYLMKQRCVDADVISHFARAKTLYEDSKYHNAVFVGLDENGVPRHAHKRSTLTIGEAYRGNAESSDPKHSFRHMGTSDRLYVFEAPIDLLSFVSLYKTKGWQKHSYLALCGVAEHGLFHALEATPRIRRVGLCLDNDKAGLEAMDRITEKLKQAGYDEVSRLLSHAKDWNADLQAMRCMALGQPREPCPAMALSP